MKTLIAMQNKVYASYLSQLLKKMGDDVELCDDGRCTIQKMSIKHYDRLILGITLDFYNGLEVLSQLKEKKSATNTQIIVITRIRNKKCHEAAVRLGASYYHLLPLDTTQLLRSLEDRNH